MLNLILCAVFIIYAASCRDIAYAILWAFLAGMDFYQFIKSIISKLRED